MTDFPFVRPARPQSIVAYRNGQTIRCAQFLAEAAALAEALPDRPKIVNLCSDRYRFAVALAAALLRRQVTLLPPNDAPATLGQLAAMHPEAYCLSDTLAASAEWPAMAYPEALSTDRGPNTPPAFAPDQTAVVVFTSGSTGRPMPQVKSWGSLICSTLAAGDRFGISALTDASLISTVPHRHMYGLESSVMLPLQHGVAFHAGRPFYPGDVCARLEELPRPRILITTPIHLRALLADAAALPAVDLLLCATAPLAKHLAIEAEARFAARLYEVYGCSEAGQVAARRTVEGEEWHCIEGITLCQDERGTWARGALMEQDVLLNDIIEFRGCDGFVLLGRTADLVNIAGKRTSIAHLNHHLTGIEGVRDGAFVMPEEAGGAVTRLVAFVVAPGLTTEQIIDALRQHIDGAFLPRPLYFVDALPRTQTGKLPRDALDRLLTLCGER